MAVPHSISCPDFNVTDGLHSAVYEASDKINRYIKSSFSATGKAHFTIKKEANFFEVTCQFNQVGTDPYIIKESSNDCYKAIKSCSDKMVSKILRHNNKMKNKKGGASISS